jgi:hypothetical protein
VPNGPKIPPSANFDSLVVNGLATNISPDGTSNITNQGDIKITTTDGSIYLTVGTDVYKWPTSPPPGNNFVLGVDSHSTTDGITTYLLGWTEGFICFHVSSKVMLEDGTSVTMDKLKYGDKVLSMDNNMGLVYSPIVDFTGVFPNRSGTFVRIYSNRCSDPLTLSGIHMVATSAGKFIQARDLKVGMVLMSKNGSSEIINIETGVEVGWYTPLTKTGTIVVDDIVSSCHTKGPHSMVRFMYKPLYLYLYLFPHKVGTFPVETNHWYSIGFRRGPIGCFIERMLKKLDWT